MRWWASAARCWSCPGSRGAGAPRRLTAGTRSTSAAKPMATSSSRRWTQPAGRFARPVGRS
eukprot:6356856-Prymnesium_polylepis.1